MSNHLKPQQMLAYLDGELSRSETRRVEDHLHSCWTCRSEVERLKDDIALILDAQNESFASALPPPPNSWPSFHALLARVASPPLSIRARILAQMNSMLSPVRILVSITVAGVLMALAFSLTRPRPVSAKEILHQLQLADTKRENITKSQVIRERIHIRRTARHSAGSQSTQLETWKSPTAAYWDASDGNSLAADLESHYKANGIPISLPLSAESVNAWGTLAGGNPQVSQEGANVDLNFSGSSARMERAVERVNLLIQPQTWEVKRMTLDFRDASFEVTEDDFSVVPVTSVRPELLAYLEPLSLPHVLAEPSIRPASGATANLIHAPVVNLERAELNVFAMLHRLKADLGEPVSVTRSSTAVIVGVWELPPERQVELRDAFASEPGVEVELTAPSRATVDSQEERASMPTVTSGPIYIPAESGGDDERLLKFLGGADKEQDFTNQILASSTTILSHLYALRNLQGQFPPGKVQALSPEERSQLTALVQDHATVATANLGALRAQLAPLYAAFTIKASEASPEPVAENWQSNSLEALESGRTADHLLRSMLTTSQTPVLPDMALPLIEKALAQLSADLNALNKLEP